MPLPDFTAGTVLTAAALDAAFAAPFPTGIDGWTAFIPTLVQGATVSKTVSHASYMKIGRLVHATYALNCTSSGTAANVVQLGLPVPALSAAFAGVGSCMIFDASASVFWHGHGIIDTATTVKFASYNAGNYLGGGGFVAALAAGDIISASLTYQSAS